MTLNNQSSCHAIITSHDSFYPIITKYTCTEIHEIVINDIRQKFLINRLTQLMKFICKRDIIVKSTHLCQINLKRGTYPKSVCLKMCVQGLKHGTETCAKQGLTDCFSTIKVHVEL